MKRLPWIALAVVIIAGCAGGGTNVGGTGTTGASGATGVTGVTGATGSTVMTVNLVDSPGLLDTYFLTAQGRAPGDLFATLINTRYKNDNGQEAETGLGSILELMLNGTAVQSLPISAPEAGEPLAEYPDSKTFDQLDLTFSRFRREDDNGNLIGFNGVTAALSNQEITVFRGRRTAVQLFLNDSMFTFNGQNTTFDMGAFLNQNVNPEKNKVVGFMNDYLSFDITSVANRPLMPDFGTMTGLEFRPESPNAMMVHFSGDSAAISDKTPRSPNFATNGINGVFVFLTPSSFVEGFFRPPVALPNPDQQGNTVINSYELKQRDPQSVIEPRLITALKGIRNNYTDKLGNLQPFNFLLMPRSGDGRKQQVVAWTGANTITNMWFGEVDFLAGANPIFRIYPIQNLYPATTANEITGTLPKNSLIDKNGAPVATGVNNWWRGVRGGKFNFAGVTPDGAPMQGDFVVYRR